MRLPPAVQIFDKALLKHLAAHLTLSQSHLSIFCIRENVFDEEWNETQFATESRLQNETNSFEEIHFTPGTPFYLRGKIAVSF